MVYNSWGAALAEPSSDLSPVMMYARAWAALRATGSPGKGDSENIKKKLAFGEGGQLPRGHTYGTRPKRTV